MNPVARRFDPQPLPPGLRAAVVVSRYNKWITDALEAGATTEFIRRGGAADHIHVISAPGSYEVPALTAAALRSGRYQLIVALGCIIKGETSHDVHISTAVSNALMSLACQTGVPIGFGILTVDNEQQAEARAGGAKGNKGQEAMAAALDTLSVMRQIGDASTGRGDG